MISISHAPNTNRAQQRLAAAALLPWRWSQWQQRRAISQLETEMSARHAQQPSFAFSTGREALLAVFKACGITTGDEVIVQAYTCIVVPNAVIWAGAKPVYVDIDTSFNIDADLIAAAITPKTKAIVVQHTFGVPARMEEILRVAKAHNLLVIEDCAHALGATYNGQPVGTLGDAAIFSFGRDKIISSVSGGLATTSSPAFAQRLKEIQSNAPSRNRRWILQNLLHPLIVPLCGRLSGRARIGQILLTLAQKIGLLQRVYTSREKMSLASAEPLHKMPNALADLALDQLKRALSPFNAHRQALAAAYQEWAEKKHIACQQPTSKSSPVWLRFTLLSDKKDAIIAEARANGYLLGDWYHSVIMPKPADAAKLNYRPGSCPVSESFAEKSVNLPTHHALTARRQAELLSILDTIL